MSTSPKLRLGPLPKTESVKHHLVSARLKADLDRYAALHGQAYGETVDAATLIPYMLEAFMAGDRGFRRATRNSRAGHTRLTVPRCAFGDPKAWIERGGWFNLARKRSSRTAGLLAKPAMAFEYSHQNAVRMTEVLSLIAKLIGPFFAVEEIVA